MKTTQYSEFQDRPELTAYALGELDAAQNAEMSAWLEQHPDADVELDHITALAAALESTAELPTYRLHPHQRQAVLAGPQRVRELVAAASSAQRAASLQRQRLMARRVSQFAAAAAVTIGAFYAGTHFGSPSVAPVASVAKETPNPISEVKPAPVLAAVEKAPVKQEPISALAPVSADLPTEPKSIVLKPMLPVAVAVAKPAPVVAATVITANMPKVTPAVVEVTKAVRGPVTKIFSHPFISTSKDAVASVSLRPSETRPTPPKSVAPVLGAPLPLTQNSKPTAPRSNKSPELLIHAWKAEVAACPWDESRRLVRLVLQVPGEQPAASSADNAYPLHVAFDPNYVRSYRLLAQRATTPATMDAAAVHVAWYEITPNGTATEGSPRNLGHVTLPGARFTTQAMSPFDGSSLQILDRSAKWQASREDFLFESAVVGFGLLLKGEKDIGQLDHSLVLSLAEKSLTDDRTGERAKFVKLVKQAQQSTGL